MVAYSVSLFSRRGSPKRKGHNELNRKKGTDCPFDSKVSCKEPLLMFCLKMDSVF